jgi:hypothetical protein
MNEGRQSQGNQIPPFGRYESTLKIFDKLFNNVKTMTKEDYLSKEGILPPPYQIFQKNCVKFYEKWESSKEIAAILRDLKREVDYPDNNVKSMSKMFAYLGLVESLGATMIDMALLFLIASGKQIHTKGPNIRHVETFEELEGVWSLDYKLDFLDDVGLSIFKEKIVNKNTRDAIAHLQFKIENGIIRDRGNNQIDIDQRISDFWEGILILERILVDIGFLDWLKDKVGRS